MHEISKAFTAGLQPIVSSSLPIIFSNILRERRVETRSNFVPDGFPRKIVTQDQVVTFQWKRAFHVHVLAQA